MPSASQFPIFNISCSVKEFLKLWGASGHQSNGYDGIYRIGVVSKKAGSAVLNKILILFFTGDFIDVIRVFFHPFT